IPGLSAPSGLGTSISVSSVRLPGCNAVAIRVTLPGKVRSGISGTRTTASTPGPSPKASSCGTNTWVRMTSECIRVNMKVDPDCTRLLRLQGQAIVVALLKREPSLLDQIAVARVGDLGEFSACLGLLQCRLALGQRRSGLRNLVVELRGGNVRQQSSGLDPVADVDVALFDVAAGAREDIRGLECRRGRRQGDGDLAVAGADRGDANVRNKGPALLRGGRNVEIGLVVAPASYSKAAQEQQQRASAKQRASVTTSPPARRVGQRDNAIGCRIRPLLNIFIFRPHTNLGHAWISSNTPW